MLRGGEIPALIGFSKRKATVSSGVVDPSIFLPDPQIRRSVIPEYESGSGRSINADPAQSGFFLDSFCGH
jgi:hypothetical protein